LLLLYRIKNYNINKICRKKC